MLLTTETGRKPKILIIPSYDTYGGTLTFFLKLLQFHQKNQIETAVLISQKQTYLSILEQLEAAKVQIFIGPTRKTLFYKPYFSLLHDVIFCWSAYRKFQPDIIMVSEGSPDLMLGVLTYPVPVIYMLHTAPSPGAKSKKRIGMRFFIKLMSRFAKKYFLTVSRFSADSIHRYLGVPEQRIQVIYNSYRTSMNIVENIISKSKIVLTIGHLCDYKNPQIWLLVAKRVVAEKPDVQFIWVGDGDLIDNLRVKVKQLGLETQILFPGYTQQVDDYYNQVSVYFQPSLLESHGIAVVEAMSYALPCVTSNIGGLPESVVDKETGFTCDPEDVEGFSKCILQLLNDANLRKQMGDAGRRRAKTFFSEANQEQEIIKLYASLLHQL